MIDIEKILYDKIKTEISNWNEEGIYAISFFVYSNEVYEYKDFTNVSIWDISYNTESDCEGAGPLDEERWNYAFWRQNTTSIIDVDEPDEYTEALYQWYEEQGIENIGFESAENMYVPVGHYELIDIAANVARKLQEEGFISAHFKKTMPIIIHGLECDLYEVEATKKANPNGEADTYINAMKEMGAI